jgi:hypothetical protein
MPIPPFEKLNQPLDAPRSAQRFNVSYTEPGGPPRMTLPLSRPPQTQEPSKPSYATPPYDRPAVWRRIVAESGNPALASKSDLDRLRVMQTECNNLGAALMDPQAVQSKLASGWFAAALKGERPDPLSFPPSLADLNARHSMMCSNVQEHNSRCAAEALPIIEGIFKKLVALVPAAIRAEEHKEEQAVKHAKDRGSEYVPSVWLRHLQNTEWHIGQHLELCRKTGEYRPGVSAMLGGVLDL